MGFYLKHILPTGPKKELLFQFRVELEVMKGRNPFTQSFGSGASLLDCIFFNLGRLYSFRF